MEKSQRLAQATSGGTSVKKAKPNDDDNPQIKQLQAKVNKLEAEVVKLKKQLNQVVSFIKKKLS